MQPLFGHCPLGESKCLPGWFGALMQWKKQKTDHTWPDQRKLQSRGSNSRTCVLDLNKEWTNLIERPYLRVVHLSDVYLPDIVSFVHAACQKNKACWQKHNNICISFLFQKIFSPQPYVWLPPYTGVYQISWIMRVLNLPRDPISPQHLCRTLFFRYCSTTNNSTCDAPEERFLSKETSRQMWLLLFPRPSNKIGYWHHLLLGQVDLESK